MENSYILIVDLDFNCMVPYHTIHTHTTSAVSDNAIRIKASKLGLCNTGTPACHNTVHQAKIQYTEFLLLKS